MLILQKASAGSGKTYTLARQYLVYLLTITPDGGGSPRLRNYSELEDAARHILAITFTNKATAEMKERIILRLADLANSELPVAKTDYLSFIMELTEESDKKVRETAAMGLSIILNNYSDFQVSTIDSFFQTVLRTFAHEIGLNDSYGLEMDGEYIAVSAFDATLTDINTAESSPKMKKWLSAMMEGLAENQKSSWNLFAKSSHKESLYSKIIHSVKRMSDESFMAHRENLHQFYASRPDSHVDFNRLDDYFRGPIKSALQQAKEKAAEAEEFLELVDPDLGGYIKSRVKNVLKATVDGKTPFASTCHSGTPEDCRNEVFKKEIAPDKSEVHTRFADAYVEMVQFKKEFDRLREASSYTLWKLYKANMQFLPLMQAAAEKSAAILAGNNVVDIAKTNSILRRVIGDDDTPFIYERLGTRLNHYLIDEFQDTSEMQWLNLRPLVHESISRGHSNLIIGDPKQSIYRFRNADPSLITSKVADEDFRDNVDVRGASKEENTNHRSLRTIVECNNSIFHSFARRLDQMQGDSESDYFQRLYSNTAQYPRRQERMGYFSLEFVEDVKGDDEIPNYFNRIPELITSLRERGYKMSDIAVLVRYNKTGNKIVEAIREYNFTNPDKSIAVVSEESLLIAGSQSVKTVVAVLRLLAEGAIYKQEEEHQEEPAENGIERTHRRKMSLPMFNCLYQLAALSNPDATPQEIISIINSDSLNAESLRKLLMSVGSMALPSLVESIVMRFVSSAERNREAPFIAAFQDLVLDYCDRYPSDILSFLQWWDAKSEKASISSPQGLDAVTVSTLHKAKGLEYKCVIIPRLSEETSPDTKHTEWLWVETDYNALGLPPNLRPLIPSVLPVETLPQLSETPHKDRYTEYLRQWRMDVINNWYVAFTRAVAELYVFVPEIKNKQSGVGLEIAQALKEIAEGGENSEYGIPADMISVEMQSMVESKAKKKSKTETTVKFASISIGQPLTLTEIKSLDKKEENNTDNTLLIKDYFVSDPRDVLTFRDPDEGYSNRENPNPRALGNQLHDIMAAVTTIDDLPRAVKQRVVNGYLSHEDGEEARQLLAQKLSDSRVTSWFAPGLKVINERSLLAVGESMHRPDRIVVDEKGCATVIDYKFGEHRDDKKYLKQISRYVKLLRESGRFSLVKGYVWYVILGEIVSL